MLLIWRKFLDGDVKAFQELYSLYIDDLYKYGVSFYADKEMVLDCIHDLFVVLFDNKKIANNVNIKYYLFSSLRRAILKKKKENDKYFLTDTIESSAYDKLMQTDFNFEDSDDFKLQEIKMRIDQLPKRQRELIYLKYYIGLSYEEISSILEVDVSSCRTLSFRAIRQLRLDLNSIRIFFMFFL